MGNQQSAPERVGALQATYAPSCRSSVVHTTKLGSSLRAVVSGKAITCFDTTLCAVLYRSMRQQGPMTSQLCRCLLYYIVALDDHFEQTAVLQPRKCLSTQPCLPSQGLITLARPVSVGCATILESLPSGQLAGVLHWLSLERVAAAEPAA